MSTGSETAAALRVLIVEDHVDSASAISRLLRAIGHRPHIAPDVKTAVSLTASETFDLLISDIKLPDGSGLDLMRHLAKVSSIKGIALSGYVSAVDERDSQDAGFSAHLGKPVDFTKLQQTIERVVARL